MNAQFKDIQRHLDTTLQSGELPAHLYQSVDGIAQVISTIQRTKGEGWAAQVLDKDGNPLLDLQQQKQFTQAFAPYIKDILSFLGNHQTGGQVAQVSQAEQAVQAVQAVQASYDTPDVEKLTHLSKDNIDSKMESIGSSSEEPSDDPEKMTGIDNIYAKVIQRMGMINSTVNDYASKYGVLHMEKKYDIEPDIRLIPEVLAQFISKGITAVSGVPPQVTMDVMNKFKLPFRLIVFVIYLMLDVARITASVTGSDSNRKILSMMIALLDLLKGEWKKAILTFMGYYGTTPLLMGQMAKVYLTLFQTLSPTIQDSIMYGVLDTTKSFIIGILLAIFKITAPEGIRLPLIGMLEKIAKKKAEIDGTLVDAGLSARSDSFSPTFDDFNNIQTLMDDPEFICSSEFEELIEQVNKTSIVNMILQILRIPVTKEFRAYRCGTKPSRPFLTLIVDKAKENKEKQEVLERPFSSDDLQMPVSVAKPSSEIPAETPAETPVEPSSEVPVEPSSEVPAETPAEPSSEVPTETPAEPSSEVPTETPVEVAETPAEPSSEVPTETPVEVPSEVQPATSLPAVITPAASLPATVQKVTSLPAVITPAAPLPAVNTPAAPLPAVIQRPTSLPAVITPKATKGGYTRSKRRAPSSRKIRSHH
jgi:hypothetical protein